MARRKKQLLSVLMIDALIERLDEVCDDFDEIANVESNWHTASRISFYRDHVEQGIRGLREMREYLGTLTDWEIEQILTRYDTK